MKFWRRALAVTAATAVCLSGCGGSSGSETETEQQSEETQTEESGETTGGVLKFEHR